MVVLGATNRPDLIDPALLRPGRLEKLVFVEPPDADARREILRTAGKSIPLSADVDLDALAGELDGYSAADCVALLREAALTAMRRSHRRCRRHRRRRRIGPRNRPPVAGPGSGRVAAGVCRAPLTSNARAAAATSTYSQDGSSSSLAWRRFQRGLGVCGDRRGPGDHH